MNSGSSLLPYYIILCILGSLNLIFYSGSYSLYYFINCILGPLLNYSFNCILVPLFLIFYSLYPNYNILFIVSWFLFSNIRGVYQGKQKYERLGGKWRKKEKRGKRRGKGKREEGGGREWIRGKMEGKNQNLQKC